MRAPGGKSTQAGRADLYLRISSFEDQRCHGKTGAADTKMGQKLNAKDLTDPKVQASFTDAEAAKAIKEGIKENGRTKMKAFGDKLSDADIKALVSYVRGLKK